MRSIDRVCVVVFVVVLCRASFQEDSFSVRFLKGRHHCLFGCLFSSSFIDSTSLCRAFCILCSLFSTLFGGICGFNSDRTLSGIVP